MDRERFAELRLLLLDKLDVSRDLSDREILEEIDRLLERRAVRQTLRERIVLRNELFCSVRKLDVLQELIEDDTVTEIMVNGPDSVFIERDGRLIRWDKSFTSREKLEDVIQQIAGRCNRVINESRPIVDARLENGARVNAVIAPVALNGPILTIRRFPDRPLTLEDLIARKSLTEECADFLKKLVRARYSIVIGGGTGSGKTTFLGALSEFIPAEERIITIEDNAELRLLELPNLVRMEAKEANTEDSKGVTIRDLIRTALRMRPDRVIIGEVRGAEAVDLLQAFNTGHEGSLCTAHANSCRDMLSRLETMVLMGIDLPLEAIRHQIASGVDILVHLGRMKDKSRKVMEVTEVCGMKEVPCEKFHCTEAEARQLTLIENLKRKDAEPIYVAKVIQTLRDEDKLTTEEIAAEIGMPESWVVRRAKLIDLAPEWKQAVEEGTISVTTDLLEKASRYTLDIQQDAYHEIVRSYETSVRLSWRDVSREFDSRVRNLEKAPFDRKKCAICPNNSACHPTLWDFGEAPTDGAFGVCLDPRCFALKKSEAENAKLEKIKSKGITVVKVKDYFVVPMDAIASPDDNHKFACVYHDYNGNLAVRYATKDPTANEDEKKSVNTTDKERAKSLKEAVKKVKEWEKENLESWIKKRTDFPDNLSFAANIFALALIYRVNNGSFRYTLNDLARDIWHEAKIVRLHVVSELSSAIQDLEDASASITLSTFEAANDAVSLEERNLVLRGK